MEEEEEISNEEKNIEDDVSELIDIKNLLQSMRTDAELKEKTAEYTAGKGEEPLDLASLEVIGSVFLTVNLQQ